MAAPASASARPHQETDEQRKREKRERAAPRASGVRDRARSLAVVTAGCGSAGLYGAVGGARAAASIGTNFAPNLGDTCRSRRPRDQPVGAHARDSPARREYLYLYIARSRTRKAVNWERPVAATHAWTWNRRNGKGILKKLALLHPYIKGFFQLVATLQNLFYLYKYLHTPETDQPQL